MGRNIDQRLSFFIGLFLLTSAAAYWALGNPEIKAKPDITPYFMHIDGYNVIKQNQLSTNAVDMLNLDDYVFIDFSGPNGRVNLYVGYYDSSSKAYEAHSPLVCYRSQGWNIDRKAEKHTLNLSSGKIYYDEIITSFENKKELVLFWYQAGKYTTTSVYKNKLNIGINKIFNNSEQHVFLRVAVPIKDSYENSKKASVDFIVAIYPHLLGFLN